VSILIWTIVSSVFFLDQITKYFILTNLGLNDSVAVIRNSFHFTLVHNTGAAFGIFKDQTLFFISISIVSIISIIIFLKKNTKSSTLIDIALALILGGALGNLLDRLRFGYVVDFLDFRVWPVFNVADSAISIGVFLALLSLLRHNPFARDRK